LRKAPRISNFQQNYGLIEGAIHQSRHLGLLVDGLMGESRAQSDHFRHNDDNVSLVEFACETIASFCRGEKLFQSLADHVSRHNRFVG
jgi:hypothetical protein